MIVNVMFCVDLFLRVNISGVIIIVDRVKLCVVVMIGVVIFCFKIEQIVQLRFVVIIVLMLIVLRIMFFVGYSSMIKFVKVMFVLIS